MIHMKNTAEVVIVGGGIVGLSLAYHLAARGMTDVMVLEKESMVGMGSTGRCAGGFRHQFSTEVNIRLSLLSIDKLQRFEEELEQPIDFHQDGYLFLLKDPRDVAIFSKNVELQKSLGIPVEFLKTEEIARVLPNTSLTLEDIVAATYCGKDGVSDPAGVTEGYRRNAARRGVQIHTDQEAVEIEVEQHRVVGVRTTTGRISTPVVVNAAGPHAGVVGRMAGIDVPVVPLRRFMWITKPFDQAPPRWTLVIDFSTGFYFHRESGGVLFGMPNRSEPPTFDISVDWNFFEKVMETAVHRFPPIGDTAIKNALAGSYEASPDAHPILGRVPGLDGFILANGFSGHGFQHAPGVGQLIAEEILDGKAHTIDIAPLSIERFSRGPTQVEWNVV
jgi:sarcosine oxidase subunit beta